ncbi:MAG: hypothetical protein WCK75_02750 [Elusimicrobiota bacterium]
MKGIRKGFNNIELFLLNESFVFITVLFLASSASLCPALLSAWKYRDIASFFSNSSFSTWVIFVTFIAILWYTLETVKLRKETRFATELANRPLLTIDLDRISEPADLTSTTVMFGPRDIYRISVVNIGNGSAINVRVRFNKTSHVNLPRIRFDMLSKGQNVILYEGEEAVNILKDLADVRIDYFDIIGNSRFTNCKNEGARFILENWAQN